MENSGNRKVALIGKRLEKSDRSAPLVGGGGDAFVHHGVEAGALFDEDFGEGLVLAKKYCLEANEFEQSQEHGDESARRLGVREELAQRQRAILHGEPAREELNHLADGDGIILYVEGGPFARAIEYVAEDANEVDGVGGDFRFGCGIILEFANAVFGPGGGLKHLLLLKHLGGILEALVFEETRDEFAARVFGGIVGPGGCAREEHLALDVDEKRRGVNEVAGDVDVGVFQLVDIGEDLCGDLRDGDVLDVDVLLANEV